MQPKFIMSKGLATALVIALVSITVEGSGDQEPIPEKTLRLEDLERMALANNPTITQAESAIRAAGGYEMPEQPSNSSPQKDSCDKSCQKHTLLVSGKSKLPVCLIVLDPVVADYMPLSFTRLIVSSAPQGSSPATRAPLVLRI